MLPQGVFHKVRTQHIAGFWKPSPHAFTWWGGGSFLPTTTPFQYHLTQNAFEYLSEKNSQTIHKPIGKTTQRQKYCLMF